MGKGEHRAMKHRAEIRKCKERRTGPTLRSSKNKQTMNGIKEHGEAIPTKSKEEICTDFLAVVGTVIAAGVYTVAMQFFNTHLF